MALAALLQRHWWRKQPSLLARLLQPLSWLYGALAAAHRLAVRPQQAPVPVLVVGNMVVGGAGKTPTVLAVVRLLQLAGHRPAVLSRGYGRQTQPAQQARRVITGDTAAQVGDEPLLMHRRSGAPVWVGRDRVALARAACAADPGIDVLVCDDGLQHHALQRLVNLVVFDERGLGNGLLLPAGPLRQQRLPTATGRNAAVNLVLYNAPAATALWPGAVATRSLGQAWPLQAWWSGDASQARPLATLRGRPLVAAAGLAAPEKFFAALEAQGLQIQRLPLPDHFAYDTLPWPPTTPDLITTEKDAIKLNPNAVARAGGAGGPRVWVVPLDLTLPPELSQHLLALLFPTTTAP